MMKRDLVRSPLYALLSGLMLAACGGVPEEAGLAPTEETLATQEAALDCVGASVTSLNIGGMSSWGGVVSGGGTWSVSYPANGVKLSFYVNGVWRGEQSVQGDANRSGSWSFNDSAITCGSHTFEVRATPAVFDSSSTAPGLCATGSTSRTTTFTQGCPTATLSCSYSSNSINCTGSGSGGTGGPFIPFWQERMQFSDGSVSTSAWEQGSSSWSVYCAQAATRDAPTYRQTINFKVRDGSGMDSPIRTYTRLCAY